MLSERIFFICECENIEHQIVFTYFPDEKENRNVYMKIHLVSESNILKRIWNAIKYIFGYKSQYGDFDEFIFKESDVDKLKKVLKFLNPNVFNNKSQESKNNSNS